MAAFTWGFQDANNQQLVQCQPVDLGIYTGNATQTINPPYYVFAFPVNEDSRSPSIQSIGTSTVGSYTAEYEAGTQLVLGVVDAFGLFGGWSPVLTVQDSSSDDCTDSIPSPALSLTLNTTQVSTCDVVGVQVSGGSGPFTFTVLPVGSVTTTFNITGRSDDNYLSWVNDVAPASTVGFGVRNSRGEWAAVSQVSTVGQAQSCSFGSSTSNGAPPVISSSSSSASSSSRTSSSSSLQSSSSISTTSSSAVASGSSVPDNSSTGSSGSSTNAGAIAGGVVGGLVALALLILGFWLWRRRQRRQRDEAPKRFSYHSAAYNGPPSPRLTNMLDDAAVTPFSLSSAAASHGHSGPNSQHAPSVATHSHSASQSNGTPMSQLPPISGFRIANPSPDQEETLIPPMLASGHGRTDSQGSRRSLPYPPIGSTSATRPSARDSKASMSDLMDESRSSMDSEGPNGRRLIQHQDGGAVEETGEAEEIPPAYTGLKR